jgi:hypothetical protein
MLVKSFEKKQTALSIKHPGRNRLPDSLRRQVIELMPREDVQDLKPVGKQITEMLEYQPGELYVKQFIRPEYIKPSEDGLNAKGVSSRHSLLCHYKKPMGRPIVAHSITGKQVCGPPTRLPPVGNI